MVYKIICTHKKNSLCKTRFNILWHFHLHVLLDSITYTVQDQANLEKRSRTRKMSDPEMCVKTPCFVAMQSAVTENALIPLE